MSSESEELKQEETGGVKEYTPPHLSDDEIKKIAIDFYHNKIFSSIHIMQNYGADMLKMVFVPILFLRPKNVEDIGMIYEYYSKAGPRAINGCPIFMSMKIMHNDDMDKFFKFMEEYEEMQRKFLNPEKLSEENGKEIQSPEE